MRLTARAPGKVNLCLFLDGVRADGRHRLVTVLESVSLADRLELIVGDGEDAVECPELDGPNLAESALAGLRELGWDGPPVRLAIAKEVPIAAGMGGGSADAAATVRLAGALAPLPPEPALNALLARLGADVPSQLVPGLALGTGAGERVRALTPLAPHAFVLVPLAERLSTGAVYDEADRLGLGRGEDELRVLRDRLAAALTGGAELPKELLVNDLEPAARSLCAPIGAALEAVSDAGADRSFVCGSGPTVAGLFWNSELPADERARAAAGELGWRFASAVTALPVDAEFGAPKRNP